MHINRIIKGLGKSQMKSVPSQEEKKGRGGSERWEEMGQLSAPAWGEGCGHGERRQSQGRQLCWEQDPGEYLPSGEKQRPVPFPRAA